MKDLSLIVWLTQMGFSVAFPLAGFIWLAVWLRDTWGWGEWVIWVGIVVGICCALDGLRISIRAMTRLAKPKKKEEPKVAFNDHD